MNEEIPDYLIPSKLTVLKEITYGLLVFALVVLLSFSAMALYKKHQGKDVNQRYQTPATLPIRGTTQDRLSATTSSDIRSLL